MSEGNLWSALRPRLAALGLDPVRVENVLGSGTPDVNYTAGWLELKWLEGWPRRTDRPVRVPSLQDKPGQVAWLTRRWAEGGPAYLLLGVGCELLLFAGPDSRQVRAGVPAEELRGLSVWHFDGRHPWGQQDDATLKAWLTWDAQALPLPSQAQLYRLRCGRSLSALAAELGRPVLEVAEAERHRTDLTYDLIDHWTA